MLPTSRSSQVLLWSFCLFPCQSSIGFTDAAQAYYTRETVRAGSSGGARGKSTHGTFAFHFGGSEPKRNVVKRWEEGGRSDSRNSLLRVQVNLKSTTGQTVRVPTPSIDFRSLQLALKVSRRRVDHREETSANRAAVLLGRIPLHPLTSFWFPSPSHPGRLSLLGSKER